MNHEQLAFVNQQLAGMLRSGIPLEGALQQLCRDLQHGALRTELDHLQADLAQGIPLAEAAGKRRLPELYRRLLALGAQSNDLPAVLAHVGDYYQRTHLVWTRLKGLLVYPVLVLAGSAALAAFIASVMRGMTAGGTNALSDFLGAGLNDRLVGVLFGLWVPAGVLGLLTIAVLTALAVPSWRLHLRWRLPGFRESALAQLASTMHLLLAKGCPVGEAVALVQRLEGPSPAGLELGQWSTRIAEGLGKPAAFAAQGRVVPPLFRWLIAQGGEDLSAGFRRAADLYHHRAMFRIDLLLHLALPLSVMGLGLILIAQFYPLMRLLVLQLNCLGDVGGL